MLSIVLLHLIKQMRENLLLKVRDKYIYIFNVTFVWSGVHIS
jgi:hypothetical protein